MRIEQKPRGLDRIACQADEARSLAHVFAVLVSIEHTGHFSALVVMHLKHLRLGTQVKPSGFLRFGYLGVERRPFCAGLAALKAKAQLPAGRTVISRATVNSHPSCVYGLITNPGRPIVHYLEIVIPG